MVLMDFEIKGTWTCCLENKRAKPGAAIQNVYNYATHLFGRMCCLLVDGYKHADIISQVALFLLSMPIFAAPLEALAALGERVLFLCKMNEPRALMRPFCSAKRSFPLVFRFTTSLNGEIETNACREWMNQAVRGSQVRIRSNFPGRSWAYLLIFVSGPFSACFSRIAAQGQGSGWVRADTEERVEMLETHS